ncbi:MAG: hypothetical protein EZS28_008061 [Streblomastix strix]|uniref:Uncharacterized protein n=1 Tax=Streblomastix strix TaxID=222440 RepID=A0A5J4WNM0_9EUKA|nr:MAG: hypothetical protein EZS28_008061 [Streblomastix strix]
MNYVRRIISFEGGFKKKYKQGEEDISKCTSLKGDLALIISFDYLDTQIKVKKYLFEVGVRIVDDDNKENLLEDEEKEDETDALINKMMAAENKDDKKKVQKKEKKIKKRKINMILKKNWKKK